MPFLRWNRRTHIDFGCTYCDIVIKYDNPGDVSREPVFRNIIISRKTFQTQPDPTRPENKNGTPRETCSGADLLRRRVYCRLGERLYYRLST